MRAAAYIRVSTQEQAEFSPEAQRKAIEQYAKRQNMELLEEHIYVDEGFSGRKAEKRPGFMAMIQAAKAKPKPFDCIIVHRFDRFARNREDSVVYKALLKKEQNIRVISVTEPLEEDKFSVILESMLEAMAEYYSLNLADEVRKGMKEKAERGGFQGKPPIGYQVVEKGSPPHVVEDEANIIRYIFQQFIEEQKECSAIAKALNEMGYSTRNHNAFETRGIEYILRNPMYCGDIRWNYQANNRIKSQAEWIISQGTHPPIVGKDKWQQAQELLDKRNRNKNKKSRPQREYRHFLSGLLRCGYCGGAMTYINTHGYTYYRCNKRIKGSCSHSNYIRVDGLTPLLMKQIKQDMQDIQFSVDKLKTFHHDPSKLLEQQLTNYDKQLWRIKSAYIKGIDSLEEYENHKDRLLQKKNKLHKELMRFKEENPPTKLRKSHQLYTVWGFLQNDALSLQEKNTALKSFIKYITVYGEEETIVITYVLH